MFICIVQNIAKMPKFIAIFEVGIKKPIQNGIVLLVYGFERTIEQIGFSIYSNSVVAKMPVGRVSLQLVKK